MINPGYNITVLDDEKMKKFKNTSAYGTYLKAISGSPAYAAIMNEHINNVDIVEDVKRLKEEGKLPDKLQSSALNDLFKQALSRMAICLVADTVILKELENIKIDSVLAGVTKDRNVMYLLGKAEDKHYQRAAELLKQGKLEEDSLAFRGLMAYVKQHEETLSQENELELDTKPVHEVPKKTAAKKKATKKAPVTDFDSNDVKL